MKTIVILISGRGSNMLSLLDAIDAGALPLRVAAVISNRPDAQGLLTAQAKGIPTRLVDHTRFAQREAFDAALQREIDAFAPDFVVLAGFMRILTEGFVQHFAARLINIHPSLLPAFPGLHTHQRALDEGVRVHGCTVHFVTPALDHGPIIAQAVVPVADDDDANRLAARVLVQEHRLYPLAMRWLAEHPWRLDANRVRFEPFQNVSTALIAPWFGE